MKIDSIINGIVIDHIAAGRGMQLYKLLGLDKLEDCSVAIIMNVHSKKMGRKDIIKVDANITWIWMPSAMWTPTPPSTSSRTAPW